MIKFFRHLRQRLLNENKFSKYLLYAVGEIVLVVLGILIALRINNWNESRKAQEELESIKQNLTQEFESNQRDLQSVLNSIRYTKNGGLEILSIISASKDLISEEELNIVIEKSLFFPTWKPSNYTLSELKNAGKLALVDNDSLKQLLFDWDKQIENVEGWNRRMEKSSQDIVDYIKTNASLRNVNYDRISTGPSSLKASNLPLLQDVRFENQIDEKVLYAQFMEQYLEEANTMITNILMQIYD